MIKEFIGRENEIFDILDRLKNNNIEFTLIGGYAVSAYKHRFSVDADIVVKEEQLNDITKVLVKNNFKPYKSMSIGNIYKGRFMSFIKETKLPITVDLLINSVTSRQTNASWSFELFRDNLDKKEISGIEKSIVVDIPKKELLIATKIHSCRLTDIRDVVALCDGADINKIVEFSKRGEPEKLKALLNRFKEIIKNKNFIDAFKGVFSLERFPAEKIEFSEKIIYAVEESINNI